VEAQQKSVKKIKELSTELANPSQQINIHEKAIADLIPKERQIRAQGKIAEGKRILPAKLQLQLNKYKREISFHKREIKKIEKEYGNKFKTLRKHQKTWLRLQGKEKVYEIDVELDQIVTFHRISLANLFAYFIKHFLDGASISMVMILHKIIHLHATIEEGSEIRKIKFRLFHAIWEPPILSEMGTTTKVKSVLYFDFYTTISPPRNLIQPDLSPFI
jgi:hypothetical protein